MTQKDFIALAAALKEASESAVDEHERFGVGLAVRRIVAACKASNPRFNTERFCKAAGFEGLVA